MKLIPLGVGDAFSERRYSSALALVAEDGRILLVDCPHPIRKMLREASLRSGVALALDRVVGLALTHLHADHASGIESLAYFFHFALRKKLPLACHPEVAARLWDGHLAAGMEQLLPSIDAAPERRTLADYLELCPLDLERPVTFGGFSLECRRTLHHIPTTALRIRSGGASLGYSADTAFDPGLIAWLAEADLLVHETNFGVHTPYEKLAALPADLRARIRLIHYPDSFDTAASAIAPLEEGRVYEVRSGEAAAASPIRIRDLDHVVFRVADLARSKRFYCEVLGCTEEKWQESIGLLQLRAGSALIDLVSLDGKLGRAGGGPPAKDGRNVDHVCVRLAEFDEAALRAHLLAHGVTPGEVGQRYGAEGEGRSMYLQDPDGNTIELKAPGEGA